jgi:hypothetical protein
VRPVLLHPLPAVAGRLQCLTRLQIHNVEVEPCGLDPLTALTSLAHISWAVVIPTQSGLDLALHPKLRMAPYLARWAIWDLPLAELAVEGAVLDHGDMALIGRCRHLTRLELLECKGMAAPIVGQDQDCCPYGPDGRHDHLKCLRYGMRAVQQKAVGMVGFLPFVLRRGRDFVWRCFLRWTISFSKYQKAGGRGAGRTPRHKHSPKLHGVPAAAAALLLLLLLLCAVTPSAPGLSCSLSHSHTLPNAALCTLQAQALIPHACRCCCRCRL